MNPRLAVAAAILAVATLAAPLAQAASFTFTGGTAGVLPGDFNPAPAAPGATPGASVLLNGTLGLTAAGRVTYTYFGTEAAYSNRFLAGGSQLFANHSGAFAPVERIVGAGPLDFAFSTTSPAQTVANGSSQGSWGSIALLKISDKSVYALFNDGAIVDADYDDMVVRMDVAPVPLPAAAWLLMTALGGLGLIKRRATAAA